MLQNDDIKLDATFKLSIMMDVAKGMEYIHKCPLHSHGNLKSSNCLVDARWVVKVTLVFVLLVSCQLYVLSDRCVTVLRMNQFVCALTDH